MKQTPISFFSCAVVALVALPLMGRADTKPDFEDDAKPILSQQPGLIEYVESRYQVKDTGIAKAPGDDDHAPQPPYIFRARPLGSNGPFNVKLLIQPGPPGHILGIVKDSPQKPTVAATTAIPTNQPTPVSSAPATPQSQPALTSDTPSGPITVPGKTSAPTSAPTSNGPSLTPPSDPAPAPH